MKYIIRECGIEELPLLQKFINEHWKKGHSLAKSVDLINFQHLDKGNNSYNFLLGINPETNEIDGIMGYVPTSLYDPSLHEQGDYWGAIWKVRTDIENSEIKLLGLYLWEALTQKENLKSVAAIGISKIAKKFYKIARMKIGFLSQYYILRNNLESYNLAGVKTKQVTKSKSQKEESVNRIEEITIQDIQKFELEYKNTPSKSATFLENRYARHPFYSYQFFSLSDNNRQAKAIIVTRTIEVDGSKAIRIVDCVGTLEDLPNLSQDFQDLLTSANAEYIDCMNFGLEESVFQHIGFTKLDIDSDEVIIPNYFEPFEKRNVKIEFAYKSKSDDYVIFKGDSDQDRPNIL